MLSMSTLSTKLRKIQGYKLKWNSGFGKQKFYFYEYIRPVLLYCKMLGFLPLKGLTNNKGIDARLSWRSWYSLIYFANLIWTTIYSLTKCLDKVLNGLERNNISGLIFSVNTLISSILMMKLSIKWNKYWHKIEQLESSLNYCNNHGPMKLVRLISIATLSCATVEFIMYIFKTAKSLKDVVNRDGGDYCFTYFFITAFDWFFDHITFNCGLGILLLISNIQAVGLRNLTDVFVISVTVYLCSHFIHFNRILLREQEKSKRSGWMPWSDLQKHYTKLTHLVLLLDDLINPFIFVSFSCNILFICKQIFKIVQALQSSNSDTPNICSELTISNVNWEPVIYLTFSITFVIIRAALVSLLLAHHHTLTREPLNVLHTVPASVYNYKMQRFMDQIFHSKLSLSGLKFFYVTRESILSMIATLVKYELVLIQFPER